MKKLLAAFLAVLMLMSVLAGCANNDKSTSETTAIETNAATAAETSKELSSDPVRVFTLKGPTGMGMAPLMDSKDKGNASLNYQFTVAGSPDEFTGDIIQGNFEIACVPTNLAAVLSAKTNGTVQVAAVNTLGVLYVLENGSTINSINDLEGKTIYSSGQGAVPEYALNYILKAFGVNCEVIYESEHDVVVSDIMTKKANIAVLPEPKVTAALKNNNKPEGLRIALDLNKLWDEACAKNGDDSALYMGCIIVRKDWAESNKKELSEFLNEYKTSVDLVNNQSDTASEMIAKYGIIPAAPLAKAAIPNSNIVFINGDEMKKGLSGFLKVLYDYNPASVGGKLPTDEFYY